MITKDTTKKVRDWQINQNFKLMDTPTLERLSTYSNTFKSIPVYMELSYIPNGNIELSNIKWIDVNGVDTPFYPWVKQGL